MIKNFSYILAIILVLILVFKVLKLDLKKYANVVLDRGFGFIGATNSTWHIKNQKKAKLSNDKVFARSKIYVLTETIIKDLGYRTVTVEGFLTTLVVFSIVCNIILFNLTRSIFMSIIGVPSIAVFTLTFFFMVSSDVYYTRRYALMDSEDLIITSLSDGVYPAIKNNMELYHEMVIPQYQSFLDRIVMGKGVEESLEILGQELGEESVEFITQLIQFEETGRSGMIDIFWDRLKDNTHKREDMLEMQMFLKDLNKNFIITLSIALGLFVMFIGSNVELLFNLFKHPLGNIAIFFNLCLIVYGFAKIQSLRN